MNEIEEKLENLDINRKVDINSDEDMSKLNKLA